MRLDEDDYVEKWLDIRIRETLADPDFVKSNLFGDCVINHLDVLEVTERLLWSLLRNDLAGSLLLIQEFIRIANVRLSSYVETTLRDGWDEHTRVDRGY